MDTEISKSIFASKTFWGALVSVIATLAGFANITIDTGLQAEIVGLITTIVGVAGGALAIYGRVVAKTPIK